MRRILCIIAACVAAFAVQAQKCDSLYAVSLKQYDQKDYQSSLEMVNEVLSVCSQNTDYYIHRAKCYKKLQNSEAMLMSLNSALAIDSNCIAALTLKVQYEFDTNNFESAIECYEKILSLISKNDANREVYQTNLTASYVLTNQNEKAFEFLWSVCKETPTQGLLTNLSACAIYLGKYEEAEWAVNELLSKDAKDIGALVNMGLCKIGENDAKTAIKYFNKALDLDKKSAYALNNRGYAYYMLEKYDKALQDINASLQLLPENPYAYKNRALVYFKNGMAGGCEDLQTALENGFTEMYGDEVLRLQQEYCNRK